ncbi:cupin domain-containing protein [Chryseolinea sp. T2]|uniref:cupin domain-containing protein n=1 Tax=Chryseolinea sp. T2 TaxID=3129255 RepID=UPI0030785C6E
MKRTIVNPVIKDTVTFLNTARESAKRLTEIEITLLPGGGNTLHYHKTYSETFTAVDGELGVRIGKNERRLLKPGESYTVKPMQVHAFFNPGKTTIRFNVKIQPGHEGFENTLRILYGLAEDGLTNEKSIPKSLTHTAVIVTMSDMSVPGLLTLLSPVLKWLAARASANGVEKQLLSKYCY